MDNYIELKEEKIGNQIITNLKLNGVQVNSIKSYKIKKDDTNLLELTLNIVIDPILSNIEL